MRNEIFDKTNAALIAEFGNNVVRVVPVYGNHRITHSLRFTDAVPSEFVIETAVRIVQSFDWSVVDETK